MFRIIFVGLTVFGVFAGLTAQAQDSDTRVRIRTESAGDERIGIAVPPFVTGPGLESYGPELARVMARDFEFSGLFRIVGPGEYPAGFTAMPADATDIDFQKWRSTPAEYIVHGVLETEGNMLRLDCRLLSVRDTQQVVGKRLRQETRWARLIAHTFADEGVRYVDGVAGVASTEIVFSVQNGRNKDIYIADYDGANARKLTEHNSVSILPNVSPDGMKIAYLSYKDRYPWIYVFDRRTGLSTPFSQRVGLNHAPAWSPDGTRLAYVLSKDGNTEVYVKNLDGSNERRLTSNRFSDTEPTYSPDGRQIAFVSDRDGRAQIYTMNADGTNQRRISLQGGSSYDPDWAPNGDKIAYIVEKDGQGLELWMMNTDGSDARPLTRSIGSTESPTWSPDSRHLMFTSSRSGKAQLYTVTVETGIVQPVSGLGNLPAEGPSWGPRR